MTTNTYKCASIYSTVQDGGEHAGKAAIVVKLFGCNLQCQGFGQQTVGDKTTWDRPWETIDVSNIKSISQVPLFRTGCDSIHSWHGKFAGLAVDRTAAGICDEIQEALVMVNNPNGLFLHPGSLHETRLIFSGGEPMLQQGAICEVLEELSARKNAPRYVLVETNGTVPLEDDTHDIINRFYMAEEFEGIVPDDRGRPSWMWTVSPKIRTSGENKTAAINIEVLAGYNTINDAGQLIFAVDGEDTTWYEISKLMEEFREAYIFWPLYITTVGSWIEDIEPLQREIRKQTMDRGFYFIPRTNAMLTGNVIDR